MYISVFLSTWQIVCDTRQVNQLGYIEQIHNNNNNDNNDDNNNRDDLTLVM